MKTKDKYQWSISENRVPDIDYHSKIKHALIRDYLESYIETLMTNPNRPELRLSLVDGFCGGGHYNDPLENSIYKGSPYILLETIKTTAAKINIARNTPRSLNSQFIFIDLEKNHTDYLSHYLKLDGYGDRIGNGIYIHSADFAKVLPQIVKQIKAHKGGEHAIFILDQYSYSDVPMSSIKYIFENIAGAEVLLTFNVGSIITYLSDHKGHKTTFSRIGLEKHIPWELISQIKSQNTENWKGIIQEFIGRGIYEESGAAFMNKFFITPKGKNTWSYWFIHLANNYKASEVNKTINWRYGNHFSHHLNPVFFGYNANYDIDATLQNCLDLREETFFDDAKKRVNDGLSEFLPELVYNRDAVPFRELAQNLANHSMANESIIKESLDEAVQRNDIVVYDRHGKVRRKKGASIKSGDVLKPAAQKSFFMIQGFKNKE